MKFVLLVLALLLLGWMLFGRSRRGRSADTPPAPPPAAPRGTPVAMLACAHCGVHLPAGEALRDPAGHAYCGEPHRRAGPRASA